MGEPGTGTLLLVLDLVGTFVFALSGATAGVKKRLDLFGVLVLSFAAGNAGGIARDLLIGAVPPAAISDWRYLGVSLLAGIVTFWQHSIIDRLSAAANEVIAEKAFDAKLRSTLSGKSYQSTREEFTALIKSEYKKYDALIRTLGIKI